MIKKIKLESLYTPYTLDCYQTFIFEGAIGSEIYYYNQENGTDYEYDDFEWDYYNDEYLKALADNRLILLKDNIIDNVIIDIIEDGEPISPKFYNFTTDKVWNIFKVDINELDKFIKKNQDDYNKNKLSDCDGFLWFGDENQTRLNYYLYKKSINDYNKDDYFMDQVEAIPEYEYIDFKLIKA